MKKILFLVIAITTISCQNSTPKCDDPEVLKTILQIFKENNIEIMYADGYGSVKGDTLSSANTKITDILTTKKDNDLNSCGCEGKLSIESKYISKELEYKNGEFHQAEIGVEKTSIREGLMQYTAQRNSENELIVKVENVEPLTLKSNK